ncbi:hypothetical protein BV210_17175 [Halorientalis sp. IM1011]|uniref:DUF7511 domain-containing protein n=1 Tax=Halorientalis sp. IM1011 TaxID=1932360 RepID=UPI00097CC180|nr:hypothetical protein [Halorientalis sp. IM1011]AQL44342.1 hypothetical protein BV210_17175 [Halorientalis sp. IM1011]
MGNHQTDDVPDEAPLPTPARDGARSVSITAKIVPVRDGTAECTLYPPNVSGVELMTTWITADEDSFVSLGEMR